MRKKWKGAVAVFCAATMVAGTASVSLKNLIKAENAEDSTAKYFEFGKSDTYLQLSKELSATPDAIEATINMGQQESEYPLFDITKFNPTYKDGDVSTGKTVDGDAPGAGVDYYKFENISSLHSANTLLNIQQQRYGINDLALDFWCYNGGTENETICDDNGIAQIRLSSYSINPNKNMIYYSLNGISLKTGWNHIQIPLSSFGDPSGEHSYGKFDVHNIQSFGFSAYKNSTKTERRFTQFKLVVTKQSSTDGTDNKDNGELFDLFDITKLGAYYYGVSNASSTGMTTVNDPMGAGYSYIQFNAGTKQVTTANYGLNMVQTGYGIDDLALSFWCYNGSNDAEKLSKSGNLQISSNNENASYNLIRYQMTDIELQSGWNYIELPLSKWYYPYDKGETTLGEFNVQEIKSFAVNGYENENGTVRRFTNFKIVKKQSSKYRLFDINTIGEKAKYLPNNSISFGITAPSDPMGRGFSYAEFKNGEQVITWNNVSTTTAITDKSGFKLTFWCYNGGADGESLSTKNGGTLRLVSNEDNPDKNYIRYPMTDIKLQNGWNYIELPLSEWWYPYEKENKDFGEFDVNNIKLFLINDFENTNNTVRRFTDFELKPINSVTVETVNANELSGNYMIFSNTNVSGESTPYALFVTEKGYPSVVYGDKQFTLNKNVATRNDVKLRVERDTDGYISFYIDDVLAAKSSEKSDAASSNSIYSIGADGSGNQIMNGTVKEVKVYGDSSKTQCLGDWSLAGDILHVTSSVVDNSVNANNLIFCGSRAEDWIDYEVPSDDYWSLVFVPDIQNLTNAEDYNKTWQAMSQWIANNVEQENIKHVIGAGDSTWNNNDTQYTNALNGFKQFYDKVSWSNMIGNHDYDWGKTVRDSSMYQKYFGEDTIKATAAKTTYQGYYNDPEGLSTTENSYYRFTVNGVKWMIVQLEYHPRKGAIEWANEIIKAHPLDNVILTTHGYISGWGEYIGESMNYIQGTENGYINSTSEIWPILSSNENIKMILNGHAGNGSGSIVEKTEKTVGSKEVPVFMINAQDVDAGEGQRNGDAYFTDKPLGMLSIFRFRNDGQKVAIQYYSPSEGKSFSPKDPWGNRNSNNIEKAFTISKCDNIVKQYSNATAGTAPTDTPDGYVFAGWYTDENCETALSAGKTAANAYAKFVDADVLSVKAQLATNADKTSAAIRFVTTVDSLNYNKVGFELTTTVNGKEITADVNKTSGTSVYKTLYAISGDGLGTTPIEYKPNEEFSPSSAYFKAFTVTGISSTRFDQPFTAKAFWVTPDGTTVYGSEITRCVNDGLKKNS